MNEKLKKAIIAIKMGEENQARTLFREIIRADTENELAWLWLSQVMKTNRERMICLRQVLRLNPENEAAKKGLRYLKSRQEKIGYQKEVLFEESKLDDQVPVSTKQSVPSLSGAPQYSFSETSSPKEMSFPSGFEIGHLLEVKEFSRLERLWIRFAVAWRGFKNSWRVFARNRLAVLGVVLIMIYGLMAIAHPILLKMVWPSGIYDPITGYDFESVHPSPLSLRHPLGTDKLGRDVLSMLLAATTPAFILGLTAAGVTAVVGTAVGVISAYYGKITDTVLTHVSDAFLLLPAPLFMVIVGVAFKDFGPVRLGVLYGLIAGLGGAAVVLRSHALTVLSKPFIDMARIAGGGAAHIMIKHVVPHMLPMAATLMMLSVTGSVVADAFVSFFGFTRLYLNWGTMIYSSQAYSGIFGEAIEWNVLIAPSLALSLFAASFYLLARGLHEVADPKIRKR
ncbi:MAG: ABC transporter permease [Anaerolineales bacterium]|jgi:peptide/nickel transport system permease protein